MCVELSRESSRLKVSHFKNRFQFQPTSFSPALLHIRIFFQQLSHLHFLFLSFSLSLNHKLIIMHKKQCEKEHIRRNRNLNKRVSMERQDVSRSSETFAFFVSQLKHPQFLNTVCMQQVLCNKRFQLLHFFI
jgi:hypothetical protein